MAAPIQMDEFHLTFTVPSTLSPAEFAAVRRALDTKGFRADLRRAARAVMRRRKALARVRLTVAR